MDEERVRRIVAHLAALEAQARRMVKMGIASDGFFAAMLQVAHDTHWPKQEKKKE